jgi:hypothetical protein
MSSDQEGVTVNNADHSITMTQNFSGTPISLEEDIKGAQINQSGTKLKIPAGTMGEGSPEIILAKQ